MPTPDPRFIAQFPLQEQLIDATTGEPLSAGIVTYYQNDNRTVLKDVYTQIQQPDGTVDFVVLPNPITLTSIGTFGDVNGTDIIPFLFPFQGIPLDSTGAIELYYITVESSGLVNQFTREDWPPNLSDLNLNDAFDNTGNALSNTDFSTVLFGNPLVDHVYSVSGPDTVTPIAPNWFFVSTGTGTITVKQVAVLATDATGNPSYALYIKSVGMTSLRLVQRLEHSPRIFANGIVSGTFAVSSKDALSHFFSLNYIPSNTPTGTSYEIASGSSNADGSFKAIADSVPIDGTINTAPATTGYVDISLTIPVPSEIEVTNFQITDVANVNTTATYQQLSNAQEVNTLFSYYLPRLESMLSPSYLVGWDFPLNPCQALGVGPFVSSSAASQYIADQTILFETTPTNSTITIASTTGLNILSAASSTFAVMQYLQSPISIELLEQRLSVLMQTYVATGTANARLDLLWTANVLPPMIPFSVVTSIGAGPLPVFDVGWTSVLRDNLGIASFQLNTTPTSYSFSGFDSTAAANINTATFFAIVISFEAAAGQTMVLKRAALNGGDIPTLPAPQTPDEVLRECSYYYETSFDPGIIPGAAGAVTSYTTSYMNTSTPNTRPTSFSVLNRVPKRSGNATHELYNPANGAAGFILAVASSPGVPPTENSQPVAGNWIPIATGKKSTLYDASSTNNLAVHVPNTNGYIKYNWVCDARIGVVV